MSTDQPVQDFDFSTNTVPESWLEAASEAPPTEESRLRRHSPLHPIPNGQPADVFTGLMGGLAVSLISGVAWYLLEVETFLRPAWAPLSLGVLVALAVRLAGGPNDPGMRSTISLVFYLATSSLVFFTAGRHLYAEAYGSTPGLLEVAQHLFHGRFSDPVAIGAWALAAILSVQLSWSLRRR